MPSRLLAWAAPVFDCIEAYAPGFKGSVVGRDILTPPDLERIFDLPGGVSIGLGSRHIVPAPPRLRYAHSALSCPFIPSFQQEERTEAETAAERGQRSSPVEGMG